MATNIIPNVGTNEQDQFRQNAAIQALHRKLSALVPSSTTDNAVARYDGTTGDLQNSGVTIDDSNNVATAGTIACTNTTDTDFSGSAAAVNISGGIKISKSIFIEGSASGGFWLGSGSGNRIITINGGNSGTGNGGCIQQDLAGSLNWAIGNTSAIFGSAFDSTTTFVGTAAVRFVSTGNSETARVTIGGGYSVGTTSDPGAGAVLANTSIKSQGATAGIGYATGAGGTVTQTTSKSTGVTLNKVTGTITMDAAALAGDTTVAFTLTNSAVGATDQIICTHESGGTLGSYLINGAAAGAGFAAIYVRNITTGSLSEAIVIRFSVLKSVDS